MTLCGKTKILFQIFRDIVGQSAWHGNEDKNTSRFLRFFFRQINYIFSQKHDHDFYGKSKHFSSNIFSIDRGSVFAFSMDMSKVSSVALPENEQILFDADLSNSERDLLASNSIEIPELTYPELE